MRVFSCFVIGNGVVPLKCLEVLSRAGHQILGVYATDGSLQAWAEESNVFYAASRQNFREHLLSTEYDYLFSINNEWIIPAEIIEQAAQATINYHDSPLPKYAGLHATSWALLHGETQHAISWHEVVPDIDAGRIFKQKAVPVQPDDTAFSLNTRCFEAAVTAFAELVEELGENHVAPFPQDLSQRSYFGPDARPKDACVLSFDATTRHLYNLVRALDFGHVLNPMGLAKLWLPGGVVAVGAASPMPTPGIVSGGLPGEVLSLDGEGLCVATADGAILLKRFTTLSGQPISAGQLQEHYGVQTGLVLPVLDSTIRDKITQNNATLGRRERTWVKHLLELAPFQHPYLQNEISGNLLERSPNRYSITLPTHAIQPQTLLAMFAAYCARLSTETEFDLALQTPTQQNFVQEIFASQVPLRVQRREGETFTQFQTRFEASLERTTQLGSYGLDVFARHPELRNRSAILTFPVALALVTSPAQLDWQSLNAEIAFIAYENGSQPELIHQGALDDAHSMAIIQQLQSLMRAALEAPEQPLQRLPLLSETQLHQVLVEWNQTAKSYPRDRCIHELFTEQALRTPDAPAVRFGDTQLSYQELDQRSNQLAQWLYKLKIQPDTLIALCLPRSVELVVGLLGILKAGGAYIPIDPTYPADRVAYLIEDSGAQTVVTMDQLRQTLFAGLENVICLDGHATILTGLSSDPVASDVQPENLAYVIYTSGSTGKPKGVEICHRSLINHSWAIADNYQLDVGDRMLQSASISFDVAGEQIYPALFRGATVVVRPDDLMESFARFSTFVSSQAITTMILPTAFWHAWTLELEESGQTVPASIRALSVGTEKALGHRLEQWQKVSGGRVAFFQGYGPTETTVTSTMYCHDGRTLDAHAALPIGRPLPNTELYILDAYLQPVPVGCPGELHIGGDGLARGYFKHPELTAEKFIANPFSKNNARLYKTGDLARYLPDGNIEFLDRRDNQVKIWGFRVELGEIEAVLAQHADVKDAVVTVREDIPGDKRLMGYVVPKNEQSLVIGELNRFMKQKLPSYMMPSAFVILRALPMTSNGKVNRKALPLPQQHKPLRLQKTVFLIPGGDGGKDELIKLARLFHFVGRDQPVHGIQTRGIDGKEKPHTQIEAMALDYIQEIRSIQPHGPYLLVGECIGALVAYEVAQQLQRQGEEIALLSLLDAVLPTTSRLAAFEAQRKLSTRFLEHVHNVLHLKPTQVFPYLLDKAKKAMIWLYPDLPDPVARNHYAKVKSLEAVLRYTPQSYRGRVILLASEEFPNEHLANWENLVEGLTIHRVSGSHNLYIKENAQSIAKTLKSSMDLALAEASPPTGAPLNSHTEPTVEYLQESDEAFVAPRDELELQLAQIFEKVLGISSIGIRDSIFDLGGTSLLALQLVSKIEKTFGKNLPVSAVFESATVEQLAIALRKG
jgi:amino acid adenylation domain-containing protein